MGALLELAKRNLSAGDDVTESAGALLPGAQEAPDPRAEARKARAFAYLEAHPETHRACFADLQTDPAHVILTVALREPWGAVEVLVSRERFDAIALMELSLRHSGTAVFVPTLEH